MWEGFQHLRYSIHPSSGEGRARLRLSVFIFPHPGSPTPEFGQRNLAPHAEEFLTWSPDASSTPQCPGERESSLKCRSTCPSQPLQPILPASPARSRGPGLWLQSQPQQAFFPLFLSSSSSSSCMEHVWSNPCTHFTHISSFTRIGKRPEVTSLSPLTKEEVVLRVEPR